MSDFKPEYEDWLFETRPVMTVSAQATARRWLEIGRERAERLAQTVSGEGEHAEILGTIIGMIAEIERLRAAGDAAFYAMCNQRDNPCEELFQDAIDTLGLALAAKDTTRQAQVVESPAETRPACNGNCRFPRCRGVGGNPDSCYW